MVRMLAELLRGLAVLLPEEGGVSVADGHEVLEERGAVAWFELVSDRAVVIGVERAGGARREVEGRERVAMQRPR